MISVIVPVYKVAAYLDRCVESIVKQTYADLEIILVDDGSPDQCGDMCNEWTKKDKRIKVIHKENGGLSDARNTGIEVANGEYIGFVDSDDWIELDMYKDLLEAIERESTELAVTGINRTYDNGFSRIQFVYDKPHVITGAKIIQAYLRQGSFSTAAYDKLYRRYLFNDRRFPLGRQYEDAPVIFDILCNINKLAIVGKSQYNYFQRSNSITGKAFSIRKMDHYEFSKEIWERVKKEYPQYSDDADVFWGCKLCEILYTLNESENRKEFSNIEKKINSDLKGVWKSVIMSKTTPRIMKFKTLVAMGHLSSVYTKLKSLRVKRA